MPNKRGEFFLRIFFIFIILIILINLSSALGIRPGKIEFNFQPGLEQTITYSVFGADSETELELYVEGDLAEYVKLDKEILVGGGGFNAILKLPAYIEKPGKHRILIGAKEKFDEETLGTAVGTSINIRGVIDIHVPYPGKYLEISLGSHDVNIGEPVQFELNIASKGKEDVSITPKIEITSEEKTIETLYFKNRILKSQEEIKLYKILDTTNYNPGNYNATAIVDYGKSAIAKSKFRIGELVINIINYTKQITIGGLQKFNIEIESGWNDNIDGAYAEVFILNGSTNLLSFKTSSTSLTPWEKKNITGFFDTTNFEKGFYDANITIKYYGKDVGKISSKLVKIEFVKTPRKLLVWFIIGGIVLLLGAGVFLIKKYFLKHGKKSKRRN
jgi:hypothetical protein